MKQEVKVQGMTCQGCANSVKKQFEKIKGVESVEIDLDSSRAILHAKATIPKAAFEEALADTPYQVA